jgi:hypothetical protein
LGSDRVGKLAREGAVLVSNPILEHAVVRTGQHRSQGINSYCSIGRIFIKGFEPARRDTAPSHQHSAGTIMTEKPAPATLAEMFTPIQDLPSAPIIFFEFCPTLGNNNGLINVMLAASLVMPTSGPGTDTVPVAVAHLRCTTAAALQLREALGKALQLGAAFEAPQGRAN